MLQSIETANSFTAFMANHWYMGYVLWGANKVYSAFIGSLKMPTTESSDMYVFWFKFMNALADNFSRAKAAGTPGPEDTVRKQTVTTTEKKVTQVILPTSDDEKDK